MSDSEESEENESSYTSSSYSVNTIRINKEKRNTITIDVNKYNKLLLQMETLIDIIKTFKEKEKVIRVSSSMQTEEIVDKDKIEKENLINNLQIENDVLKSQVDMLTMDKGKILNDYNNLKSSSKEKIAKLQNEILVHQKEIKNLKEELVSLATQMKSMRKVSNCELVLFNEKLTNKILSYLPFEYIFHFCSLNTYTHSHFYHRQRCEYLEATLQNALKSISLLTSKDIPSQYSITNAQMENIYQHVINSDKLFLSYLRRRIIRSMMFIEEVVRVPLRKIKLEKIDSNLSNRMLSIIKDRGDIDSELSELNGDIVDFPSKDTMISLDNDEVDKKILDLYYNNARTKLSFDFTSKEEIKSLLDLFFRAKLSKDNYATFLQRIVEEFSGLLYDSFTSLKEIKEIEIVCRSMEIRQMKMRNQIEELSCEVKDLNKFAKSSKEIKEMLLRQKSEVELKYNDALIQIASMTTEKERMKKNIEDIDKERITAEKEFNELKMKLINEFKQVQNETEGLKKERDVLRSTLIDFKNFFMTNISDNGDII